MKTLTILLLQFCCLSLIAQNGAVNSIFGFHVLPDSKQIRSIKALSNDRVIICGDQFYQQHSSALFATYTQTGTFSSSLSSGSRIPIAYACDTLSLGSGIAACVYPDSPNVILFMISNLAYLNYRLPIYLGIQELEVFDLKTQTDGYILLCGRCKRNNFNQFFVMRFLPLQMGSMALDVTFGSDGMVTIPFGGDAQARALGLQSDGKIIVAGHEIAPDKYGIVVRLRPNGTVDTSFNSGRGYIQKFLSTPNAFWEYYTVSVDKQDIIYCGGTSSSDAMWSAISSDGHSLYDIFPNNGDKAYFTSTMWGHSLFEGGIDTEYGVNNNSLSSSQVVSDPQSSGTFKIDTSFRVGRGTAFYSNNNTNAIYGSCFNKNGNLFICGTYNDQGFIALLDMTRHYTSVSELAAPFASNIYPNPTTGLLHIQTETRLAAIDIMSLTGQVMRHEMGDNTNIDLTDLADGAYIIALHSDLGQTTYSRVIKAAQ